MQYASLTLCRDAWSAALNSSMPLQESQASGSWWPAGKQSSGRSGFESLGRVAQKGPSEWSPVSLDSSPSSRVKEPAAAVLVSVESSSRRPCWRLIQA